MTECCFNSQYADLIALNPAMRRRRFHMSYSWLVYAALAALAVYAVVTGFQIEFTAVCQNVAGGDVCKIGVR